MILTMKDEEPITYDSHPMDSRITPAPKVIQTISTRFGREFDPNTVLVRETIAGVFRKSRRSRSPDDPTTWIEAKVVNCLNTFDVGESRCAELVVNKKGDDKMAYVVRRITPKECERLQGFPDDWTDVPWKGEKHSPDSRRYKAIGNSMAVPVMRWIAERIDWSLAHPITEVEEMHIDYQPELF